jgi:glycosyltransferase involved in cell wall biosynthesis
MLRASLGKSVPVISENFRKLYPSVLFPGKTQFIEDYGAAHFNAHVHPWSPLSWSGSAKTIAEKLTDENPVYMFSHWHPFFTLSQYRIIRSVKSLRPDVKIAGIFHNVEPHERFPFQQQLTRMLIHETDIPVVLSCQTENEFRKFTGGRDPVKLFHPVYDQQLPVDDRSTIRSRHGIDENDFVLLFFGLIREYKGLDILIEALNTISMSEKRLRLLIVGEFYTDTVSLTDRISSENKDQIHIYNRFVSDLEAAEFLSISDTMVLPYRSASQSGVMSDAIFFDLPVIASELAGLTEHIEHGRHGYIVPVGDVMALITAIQRISRHTDLPAMRNHIKELKNKLSWDRFSGELLNVLRD